MSTESTNSSFSNISDHHVVDEEDYEAEEYDWKPPTVAEQFIIEEKMKRQDKISKEMGILMLQKWAMLKECCSVCYTPYMKNPSNGELLCVGCNKYIDVIDTGVNKMDMKTVETVRTTKSSLPFSTTTTSDRKEIALLLSNKLLSGYKMLSKHCPICNTPFLQSKTNEIYCVSCDMYAKNENTLDGKVDILEDENDYEDDYEWKPPSAEEQKRMNERMEKQDKISSAMGKLMLQRWAMMAEICECCTPWMKNPNTNELFCVNCNKYKSEMETAKTEEALVSKTPNITTVATTQPAAPTTKESTKETTQSMNVPTSSITTFTSCTSNSTTPVIKNTEYTTEADKNIGITANNTLARVLLTMESCSYQLKDAKIDEIEKIANAIKSLADCTYSLKKLF